MTYRCILTIKRGPSTDAGTFGKARFSDGMVYDTLEMPLRDNRPGFSCIPFGTYRAYTHRSPYFGFDVYELLNVPNRTHVEMLPGNWAGDTLKGLYNDMLGQIALGWGTEEVAPPEIGFAPQLALMRPRAAMNDFLHRASGAGLLIDIEIAPG